MGRTPSTFGGRPVLTRLPYAMYGRLDYACDDAGGSGVQSMPAEFATAAFTNNTDLPVEIHRLIPRVFPLIAGSTTYDDIVASDALLYTVSVRVLDLLHNQTLTKTATPLINLVKGDEQTWEFADPHYLDVGENLVIVVERSLKATNAALAAVQICLQGCQLITAPATDRRG